MSKELAIEVKDVSISYRILNNISIRSTLFHKKTRDEVFEAAKGVSFEIEKGGILGILFLLWLLELVLSRFLPGGPISCWWMKFFL